MNRLFLDACLRQPTARTPVWIMRQAGRYLPEYRKIREKTDILTMMKTPDLATEVTLQPIQILGVDAAIIFSDILVIPDAMGLVLGFKEGEGPSFKHPVTTESQVEALPGPAPERLDYVYSAIRQVCGELKGKVPVIGFCGSPWTLATYMIEGRSSKTFEKSFQWVLKLAPALKRLLDKLADWDIAYLKRQVEAGASALQIFDSWGGALTAEQYAEFSLPYIAKVAKGLRESGVPLIVFGVGIGHSLEKLAASGVQVVGVDWKTPMSEARQRVGGRVALQGNLDPDALFESKESIRSKVKNILTEMKGQAGHIFNLGHGVKPETPVDHVKTMVDAVKEYSS